MNVELTSGAQKVLAELQAFPEAYKIAVAETLDEQNQITVGHIQTERLSGKGPFPPNQRRLGEVTGRLRPSVFKTPAVIEGNSVVSGIGSNVSYAAVHEYGADYDRVSKPGSVKLRTDASGKLLRQPGKRGAIFAKGTHKRFKQVEFTGGKSYHVHVPARAPFSAGIEDRMPYLNRAVSNAIVRVWNSGGRN